MKQKRAEIKERKLKEIKRNKEFNLPQSEAIRLIAVQIRAFSAMIARSSPSEYKREREATRRIADEGDGQCVQVSE